jgi:glycosyltransferase involved in cell wall biosynthesis
MSTGIRCMFITRKYPPAVGGMETLAAATASALAEPFDLQVVSLGRSQRHLVWWLPATTARVLFAAFRKRVDLVVFGDALTYCALRPFVARAVPNHAVMVMGLDLTYTPAWYQRLVRRTMPHAPVVIAISRATGDAAIERGVPVSRLRVVPPGVLAPSRFPKRTVDSGARLRDRLGLAPDTTVLLTLGRLVPRKGVRWFVSEVMSRLPDNVVYVVAGSGGDEDAIRSAIAGIGPAGRRVLILGQVDGELRDALFTGADLFIMPNVVVPGDMEGFGLVAIEAAAAGALVVASELEGIRDAVIDGETGVLVAPGDASTFVERITALVNHASDRSRLAEQYTDAARTVFTIDRMRGDLVTALNQAAPL